MSESLIAAPDIGTPEWALWVLGEFPQGHPGIDWHSVAKGVADLLRRREAALERLSSHLSLVGGIDLMCSRSPRELREELDARGQYASKALGSGE